MNHDEIVGRFIVLETFAMMALGLYLANSKNDPDYSKSAALLDHLKSASVTISAAAPPAVQAFAEKYADHLTDVLAQNLRNMRGEGGQSH